MPHAWSSASHRERSRTNVLIHPEQIRRIVLGFDRGQAIVIVPERRLYALLPLVHREVDLRPARQVRVVARRNASAPLAIRLLVTHQQLPGANPHDEEREDLVGDVLHLARAAAHASVHRRRVVGRRGRARPVFREDVRVVDATRDARRDAATRTPTAGDGLTRSD